MTLIELLFFLAISGALLVLGHFVAGRWTTVGWLIGGVPVGMFWVWVIWCNAKGVLIAVGRSRVRRDECSLK